MKKFLLLLIILNFNTINLFAQNSFITTGGSAKNDEAFAIDRDAQNNIYVTGFIGEDVIISGLPDVHCYGASDVFVAKINAQGNYVWFKNFGGQSPERGLDIDVDANGNIYVTGFFYGSADFGGVTLNSNGTSQDAFILKLNNSGTTQWVYALGGPEGDIGNTIKADNNGDVIVGGQFKATADFNGLSATSTLFPNSLIQYSFDAFVAKYNSNGNVQWLRTGALSQGHDRTISITCDNLNNIYAVGQFSDTINFGGTTHNNTSANAGFIMKYDAFGNEIYFNRALGSQITVADIAVNNAYEPYITGEYKGTFLSLFSSNNSISTLNHNYTYHSFVAKYNAVGVLQWKNAIGSDNLMGAKNIALDTANNVLSYGYYQCKLNEINDTTGETVFYSMGFNDLFVSKYDNQGVFKDIQNGGSWGNDMPAGILLNTNNKIILGGSHEGGESFPMNYNYANAYYYVDTNCYASTYLEDNIPNGYSYGKSDFFIGECVDFNMPFTDVFVRDNDTSCSHRYIKPKIARQNNSDTLHFCFNGYNYLYGIDSALGIGSTNHHLMTQYKYLWSNGDTADYINIYNTGGWYRVNIIRADGCESFTDSVFTIIHNLPEKPLITDSKGINLFALVTDTITVCVPDTITLNGTVVNSGNVVSYGWGSQQSLNNDSILVVNSSIASIINPTFFVKNAFGCYNSNSIEISFQELPDTSFFRTNMLDSITLCEGEAFTVGIYDSLIPQSYNYQYCFNNLNNTYSVLINNTSTVNGSFNTDCPSIPSPSILGYIPSISGMYVFNFNLTFNNVCGTKTYHLKDSIFATVNPKPIVTLTPIDNILACPGDTVIVSTTSNGTIIWGGVIPIGINSAYTTAFGGYFVSAILIDSITGCQSILSDDFAISNKPQPEIIMDPTDGVICPNDSVKLTCNVGGLGYEWHGPSGLINIIQKIIFVNNVGYYFCIVTDSTGCQRISKTVEVKQYITPSLTVAPDIVICHTGTVTLLVVAADGSQITWQNPLSGSLPEQTVSTAGNYFVNVLSCGISTDLNANIILANPQVSVAANSSTPICFGDTIVLSTNAINVNYAWSDGSLDSILYVTQPGTYSVSITDANGCQSNTDSIVVQQSANYPTLIVPNDTVLCMNANINLSAVSGSIVNWYDANTGALLNTGLNYTLNNLTDTINLQIQANNAGCLSASENVNVNIFDNNFTPTIIADTLLCNAANLNLTTGNFGNVNYSWSGPNGFTSSSQSPQINNFGTINEGMYQLVVSSNGCASDTGRITIHQLIITTPTIIGQPQFCNNDSATYTIQNIDTACVYHWTLPDGTTYIGDTIFYSGSVSGNISCYSSTANCNSTIANFAVNILSLPSVVSVNNNSPYCSGANATFGVNYTPVNLLITWGGPNSYLSNTSQNTINNSNTSETGYYNYIITNGICSISDSLYLEIINAPNSTLSGNINYCEGDTAEFILSNPDTTFNFYWTYNGGLTFNGDTLHFTTNTSFNSITYYSSNGGCQTSTQTININVNQIPVLSQPSISPNYCSGQNVNIAFNYAPSFASILTTGPLNYTSSLPFINLNQANINQSGTYHFTITNGLCSINDSIAINIIQTPTASISGNTVYCEGDNVTLSANNVNSSYSYSWSGNCPFTVNNSLTFNSLGYTSGSINLEVANQNCIASSSIAIIIKPLPTVTISGVTNYCAGDSLLFFASSNFLNTTYNWSGPSNFSSANDTLFIANASTANSGNYNLQSTFQGCSSNLDVWINIISPSFFLGNDTLLCDGESITLSAPSNFITYEWNTGSNSNSISVNSSGVYYLSVNAMTNRCSYSDTIMVSFNDCNLEMTNVVTPNGDGVNDVFKIDLHRGKLLNGQVYNRYGNLEFEFQENVLEWNCTNRISHNIVSTGVYYYILNIEENGQQKVLKGYLHLYK